MRSTLRICNVGTLVLGCLIWGKSPGRAAPVVLADWENNGLSGQGGAGTDFDPAPIDGIPSCTGCWLKGTTSVVDTLGQSTIGVTNGNKSLQIAMVGKGAGGGEGQHNTHFDIGARVLWSLTQNDPRGLALRDAINGVQDWYTVDFDVTYDIPSLRVLDWLGPPVGLSMPPQFVGVSIYKATNNDGGGFTWGATEQSTGTLINPFDSQFDAVTYVTRHVSIGLDKFQFTKDAVNPPTYYEMGFALDGNWGTNPASANTETASFYIDNLALAGPNCGESGIDYNHSCSADPGDFAIFMTHYLTTDPPPGFDLVGDYGKVGTNHKVDFADLQKFEQFYRAANPGVGADSYPWVSDGVPEPGTLALAGIGAIGLVVSRLRRFTRPVLTLVAGFVLLLDHQAAQAQVIENFPTLGKWKPVGNTTLALSSTTDTDGTHQLIITHTQDPASSGDVVASTIPSWSAGDSAFNVLSHAVRVGAEHYNLKADVTFNPADLPGVSRLDLQLGLNSTFQTIGTYLGQAMPFTTTATNPLSAFNLPDTVDQGATSYSGQFNFAAEGDTTSVGALVDNVRLEQVSTSDLLTLAIHSGGSASLLNLSEHSISWNYLDIKSPSGSLSPAGWNSLADQNADGAGTWVEAGGLSATELAEASLLGSHTLAPGASLSLGQLYNPAVHHFDLSLVIRKAEQRSVKKRPERMAAARYAANNRHALRVNPAMPLSERPPEPGPAGGTLLSVGDVRGECNDLFPRACACATLEGTPTADAGKPVRIHGAVPECLG